MLKHDLAENIWKQNKDFFNSFDFRGIIHLPYAWSTLSLFENLQNNLTYFIPSKKFLFELSSKYNYWFQNINFLNKYIDCCEFYDVDNKDYINYFDNWDDLKNKINQLNFEEFRKKCDIWKEIHTNKYTERWKRIIKYYE